MCKRVWQVKRCLGFLHLFLGIAIASEAGADCPQGQDVFTSCRIEGRNTEVFVCHDDQIATYSYGPVGEVPDLFLSETIAELDFRPWSGVGKAIAESVVFYNQSYSYEVVGGFDRPFSDEEMQREDWHFGWIEIAQNGKKLSRLACVADTVAFAFGGGLYDAKLAARQEWDERSQSWVSVVGQPMSPIMTERLNSGGVADCLPASEFRFDGVLMGDPIGKLGKLGSPEPTEEIAFSGQQIDRMTVPGLQIDFLNDVVIGMASTSSDWDTPSGLRVGLTRGDVSRILGQVPSGQSGDAREIFYYACLDAQDPTAEWYVVIGFGHDNRVQNISFGTVAP